MQILTTIHHDTESNLRRNFLHKSNLVQPCNEFSLKMIQKLLICLIVCYFIILPIKSQQSGMFRIPFSRLIPFQSMYSVHLALQNCQSETGTSLYEKFYEIKFRHTDGNVFNLTVYIDDPSEVNILLASNNRYNSEDKDNYEIGELRFM